MSGKKKILIFFMSYVIVFYKYVVKRIFNIPEFIFFVITTLVIYIGILFIAGYCHHLLKNKIKKQITSKFRRWGASILVVGVFILSVIAVLFLLYISGVMPAKDLNFLSFIKREGKVLMRGGFVLFLGPMAYSFYTQKNKIKEAKIIAKTETAKYETLKNQLDPHFLFNSLNVLASLIHENPNKAEDFTIQLSKIYRYVLEQKDRDISTLEEEVKFAKSFTELLKLRFEDGFFVEFDKELVPSELKVVPLSLQLLLENAVKHNGISSANPLQIRIYKEGDFLVVENNKNPKESIGKSTKVGLKNIKNRYQLISKKEIEVIETIELFKVKIPLLAQNIKIMNTEDLKNTEAYSNAKDRVKKIKKFYIAVTLFCIVIPILALINYKQGNWEHNKWFLYPMVSWGIGLVIRGFFLFGYDVNWEQKKIDQIMSKSKFKA